MSDLLKVRPDAVEWREVEGEIVALDLRRSLYLAINHSGARLWPALVDGASRATLIELLSAEATIDRARAEADVDAFVADLAAHDLLLG